MNKIKFTAHSKKDKIKFFVMRVTGEIKWPKGENPTKTELINQIKEFVAKDWTRGSYHFYPNDIVVTLGE